MHPCNSARGLGGWEGGAEHQRDRRGKTEGCEVSGMSHSSGVPPVGEQRVLHVGESAPWGLWQCIRRLETQTFDPSFKCWPRALRCEFLSRLLKRQ